MSETTTKANILRQIGVLAKNAGLKTVANEFGNVRIIVNETCKIFCATPESALQDIKTIIKIQDIKQDVIDKFKIEFINNAVEIYNQNTNALCWTGHPLTAFAFLTGYSEH